MFLSVLEKDLIRNIDAVGALHLDNMDKRYIKEVNSLVGRGYLKNENGLVSVARYTILLVAFKKPCNVVNLQSRKIHVVEGTKLGSVGARMTLQELYDEFGDQIMLSDLLENGSQ